MSKNYIRLGHPTGKLYLAKNGPLDYKAEFTDIKPDELLVVIANALAMRQRFSCQLKMPWSVLQHSHAMGSYLLDHGDANADWFSALTHDVGEAFLPDVPTPFKDDIDRAKEKAVIDALPWAEFRRPISDDVHTIDRWACGSEARLFGYGWVDGGFIDSDYTEFLKNHASIWDSEEMKQSWLSLVKTELMMK